MKTRKYSSKQLLEKVTELRNEQECFVSDFLDKDISYKYYFFFDEILHKTEKAVLFRVTNKELWIPKKYIVKISKKINVINSITYDKKYKLPCLRAMLLDNYFVNTVIAKQHSDIVVQADSGGDDLWGKVTYCDNSPGQDDAGIYGESMDETMRPF